MEWRFPLAILLHLLGLVLHHNGLIDHVLEIGILGVEQLELMSSFNLFRNMPCFFSSVLVSSMAYQDNWMNELRYSFTDMMPCFRSVNCFNFIVPRGT
jgi:hypothetical protein